MSRSIGNCIADSLQLTVGYAEKLLSGITPQRFARFATPGGQTIVSNHPAFVLGHLGLYGSRIVEMLGGDAAAVKPPEKFVGVFNKDAKCVDDSDGSVYPAMAEVTETFFGGYRRAIEELRAADDALFQQANPLGGPMAEKFPTLGSMLAFLAGGHAMMHLGQLSACAAWKVSRRRKSTCARHFDACKVERGFHWKSTAGNQLREDVNDFA